MAKERTTRRPGYRWQPVVGQRRRGGVSKRWRLPRVRLSVRPDGRPSGSAPRLSTRWRRIALTVVAATFVALGGWWLAQSPLLSIRDVSIEGNRALSADVLRGVADIEGQSMLRPDFSGAEERLLALALVRDVDIERDWPNGARVTVVERRPWAVWAAGGQRFVIDDEGVVIDTPAPKGLPVIVQTKGPAFFAPGDEVDAGAVEVARQLVPTAERTLGRRVARLEFSQARGLTAVLAGGPERAEVRATFGDAQGYDFKVAALYAVLRSADEEGRVVRAVDLRFGDRVAVRTEASE